MKIKGSEKRFDVVTGSPREHSLKMMELFVSDANTDNKAVIIIGCDKDANVTVFWDTTLRFDVVLGMITEAVSGIAEHYGVSFEVGANIFPPKTGAGTIQ